MASAADLKMAGYIEYRDLCEEVSKGCRVNVKTLRMWLSSPLSKVRAMLVYQGLIVLPDDRSWSCLYSPELVLPLVAYVRWHRFGGRHSVAHVVQFFKDYNTGREHAINELPPRLRKMVYGVGKVAVSNTTNVVPIDRSHRAG